MRMIARFALAALALFAFMTAAAFAQSNTGTLTGTVNGPDGVIPGATVTIRDDRTAREITLTTSGEGTFTAPQLEVGDYTVTVTAQGFSTFTATEVKIDVGRTFSLNVPLEVGGIGETVTVVAGADVINSTSGELSETVTERQIQELPLNGRNPLALITLQAGTASNGATSTVINGQQSSFTNITRDGINVQDNFIRSNATDFIPDRPNVDDVGEFTITTQNAGAEAGYGGSQVQLVTPRGGSEFHGAAFIYNRNSEFAANTFFNNLSGLPRPFLNRNQFGGRLSGPLVLPRFGEGGPSTTRGNAFFFASYEGFRLRQSTTATRTILLPGARTGNFTFVNNAGALQTVNILQLAGGVPIDPVVQSRILGNLPTVGNRTDVGDQRNTTGLSFSQLQNQDRESFTIRGDGDINERNSVSVIYSFRDESLLRPDIEAQQGGAAAGFGQTPFGFQTSRTHGLTLAYRMSPGASFTNEIRGGIFKSDPLFDRTNLPTDFFFTVPLISNPESGFELQGRNTTQYNIQDNAVLSLGNHSVRFGGQAQFFRINPLGPPAFSQSSLPTLTIGTSASTPSLSTAQFAGLGGISTAQLGTANALLGLLGGFVSGSALTFNATGQDSGFVPGALRQRNLHYENVGLYVADQWRISPQFTLNYGVRYELFRPLRERDGLALEPVIPDGTDPLQAILDPNGTYNFVGTNAGGNRFFRTDKNNFAPIISFAYSPNFGNSFLGSIFPGEGRTVIRGGYRISYVNDEFVRGADNALAGNLGLTQTSTRTGLNARLSNPGAALVIPTPAFAVPRTFAQNNALAGNFGTVFAVDPDLEVPMTQEYNFGIQREIGFQTVIEARYVGGRSNNLIRGLDFNQVDIFSNGFLADFNRARSNLLLTGDPACTPAQNPGCQTLTVFPRLALGGLLSNATIRSQILAGVPADLAITFITNPGLFGTTGSTLFLPNPNTGVADLLGNSARYRYNSLQTEIRRRFSQGLSFQANYTFQRTLTDTGGTGQTNFDPALDNNNLDLEYQRADYDSTHVFNFNGLYELPFGRGRRFLNQGGVANFLLGGFQIGGIVNVSSGAPVTLVDPRGTLNRAARSGRQTPTSSLTNEGIQGLFGIFRTPCGVFFIDPSVININQSALQAGNCSQLTGVGGATGRGAEGFGTNPFPGQVFFNVAPGATGNVSRAIFNGPVFFNVDASIIKNFPLDFIREGVRFQIRGEAFNMLNRTNFFIGNIPGAANINSTNFGRVLTTFSPRIVQFVGRFEF